MNWLKKLFSTIGSFFKRAAKTVTGVAAQALEAEVMSAVNAVEMKHPDAAGGQKAALVFDQLRANHPDVKTAAINLAIELAVVLLKG